MAHVLRWSAKRQLTVLMIGVISAIVLGIALMFGGHKFGGLVPIALALIALRFLGFPLILRAESRNSNTADEQTVRDHTTEFT